MPSRCIAIRLRLDRDKRKELQTDRPKETLASASRIWIRVRAGILPVPFTYHIRMRGRALHQTGEDTSSTMPTYRTSKPSTRTDPDKLPLWGLGLTLDSGKVCMWPWRLGWTESDLSSDLSRNMPKHDFCCGSSETYQIGILVPPPTPANPTALALRIVVIVFHIQSA